MRKGDFNIVLLLNRATAKRRNFIPALSQQKYVLGFGPDNKIASLRILVTLLSLL